MQITDERQTKDQIIIESVQRAYPLLRHIASHNRQDYDDLCQIAAEAALFAYAKARAASNMAGYLHRTIRHAALSHIEGVYLGGRAQRLSDHYQIVSLDAPLAHDPRLPLGDTISTETFTAGESRDFSCLYAVLSTLPEIHAQAICMRFGLCGYGTHRLCDMARVLGVSEATVRGRLYRGLVALRKHTELLAQVKGAQA